MALSPKVHPGLPYDTKGYLNCSAVTKTYTATFECGTGSNSTGRYIQMFPIRGPRAAFASTQIYDNAGTWTFPTTGPVTEVPYDNKATIDSACARVRVVGASLSIRYIGPAFDRSGEIVVGWIPNVHLENDAGTIALTNVPTSVGLCKMLPEFQYHSVTNMPETITTYWYRKGIETQLMHDPSFDVFGTENLAITLTDGCFFVAVRDGVRDSVENKFSTELTVHMAAEPNPSAYGIIGRRKVGKAINPIDAHVAEAKSQFFDFTWMNHNAGGPTTNSNAFSPGKMGPFVGK